MDCDTYGVGFLTQSRFDMDCDSCPEDLFSYVRGIAVAAWRRKYIVPGIQGVSGSGRLRSFTG